MQNYERDFQKQFTFKSQIGSGTFGIVKKCIWNKNQKLCAVKCVDNVNQINIEKIQQEATIMKNAKSDYSLELYDHFFDRNNLQYILVMPFCKFGSLEKKISENWSLDSILLFMYQITQAFVDFSEKQITHLDLKPQNILIKSPGQYVVCDFGCSKVIQDLAFSKNFLKLSLSKGLGTPDYAAPQIQLNNEANKYSDIWSLGVIIYRMIYHKLPFTRANMGMSFLAWKTSYEGHSPQLDPIVAILKRMLSLDKRPSWKELRTQIYQILKIDDKIEIVTSASEYKQYVKNLSVIGTCLLHHIDRIQDDLQVLKVNYRPMINTFLLFLQKLTEPVINPDVYYMFELTKSRIKMDEKQHIAEIHKQIQNIIKGRQINYSEANNSLSNLKSCLLKQVKAFSQSVRKLKEEERKKLQRKPENEYFKVKKILQFVSAQFGSNLSYCKKHQLEEVVHYLVYS